KTRRQYLLCLASDASAPAPAPHPTQENGTPAPKNQAVPSPLGPDSSSCTAPSLHPIRATRHCSRKTSAPANASSPPGTRPHRPGSKPLAAHSTPPRSQPCPPRAPQPLSSASPFAPPVQTTGSAPHPLRSIESSFSSSLSLLRSREHRSLAKTPQALPPAPEERNEATEKTIFMNMMEARTLCVEPVGSVKEGFFRRRIARPIVDLLRQGVT